MKYACDTCGAIYDEALGDPKHKIPAGTAFTDLPRHYACPLCGGDKDSFLPVEKKQASVPRSDPHVLGRYIKYPDAKGDSQR